MPFLSPGDLPDPGIKHMSLMSPALAGRFFTTRVTWKPWIHLGLCLTQSPGGLLQVKPSLMDEAALPAEVQRSSGSGRGQASDLMDGELGER